MEFLVHVDPSFVMNGHFSYHSGKDAIAKLFLVRKLKPGKDIEVIVCASDLIARGALDELEVQGIRVPSDIALTGFDGIRYDIFPIPRITTVCQHVFEIGRISVSNLLAFDPGRKDVVFNTELIIHTSCGCGSPDTGEGKTIDSPMFLISCPNSMN